MGDYGLPDMAFLLLGGILGTGSLTMIGLGIWAIRSKHRAQQTYLPVDAVVLSHRLVEHRGDGGDTYEPRVEYEYVLDGVTHKSSNVWAGPNDSYSLWPKEAQEILDQFPEGQQVEAFCDPGDPEQAFLLHTPPASGVFGGHFVLFFCAVVIVILLSIAWRVGLFWELIGAHALAVVSAFGWFAWAIRREGKSER